jgi:hypothetical protein
VRDQLHATTAFHLVNNISISTAEEAGCAPQRAWPLKRREERRREVKRRMPCSFRESRKYFLIV